MNNIEIKTLITNLTGLGYKYNSTTMKGGDILAPKGKMFKDVVSLDFSSYYPNIAIKYNLFGDKLTDFLNHQYYLKEQGDQDAKLVMSQIYGYFKHFDINKAAKITEYGRRIIRKFREFLEKNGFEVIYSHTDSVMLGNVTGVKDYKRLIKCKELFESKVKLPISVENKFKYIYFKENNGVFVKNRYIGVNYDDTLYFNGYKPNLEEISMLDFITYKLRKGEISYKPEEILSYLEKYHKKTDTFINLERINIIEIQRETINLES